MKLVIIEGIGKKETIEKYLGPGYKVFATKGHIRDLPVKTLGVDVNRNFEPKYETIADKKDIIKKMQAEAATAQDVFLATDPDREGEAISWHVAHLLKIPQEKKARIVFNEISKKAVTAALNSPREIDKALVDAQQARRVLDRLVGYKVSPILCKRVQNNLSAGRVQSVTLRLVVERDREIAAFKPEEYWTFASVLSKDGIEFKAPLSLKDDKKYKIRNAAEVERVKADLNGKPYVVTAVKKSVAQSRPSAPFITSSMQQDALNKLGMSLKQTSAAAQALYEGVDLPGEGKVALITYIRTDSTRVSDDAIREARAFVAQKYGDKYIPAKPNIYASKKGAQDAHEAIRPITVERTPESLQKVLPAGLFKLYKLIYDRFLASQMSAAEYDVLTVDIQNGAYCFKVVGRTLLFAGFTAVYKAYEEEKEDDGSSGAVKLPMLKEGDRPAFIEYKYEQKFTKPPPYYTEASLVKTMEEKGIGRPATYTPTVSLLLNRQYLVKDGKLLKSSELGMTVTDMLIKYFPDILDVKFTAEMEDKLDKIEDGGKVWQGVVADFYEGFYKELTAALGDKAPDEESGYTCPECQSPMVYRSGRFGKFLACTGFPKCRFTQQIDENGNPSAQRTEEESDVTCDLCGKKMIVKTGKYGKFLACPGYPKCRNIKNTDGTGKTGADKTSADKTVVGNSADDNAQCAPCPVCGKPMAKRKGRTPFYGCTGYPECKFTSSSRVIDGKCPQCAGYLVEKQYKDGIYSVCGKGCGFKQKTGEAVKETAEEIESKLQTANV